MRGMKSLLLSSNILLKLAARPVVNSVFNTLTTTNFIFDLFIFKGESCRFLHSILSLLQLLSAYSGTRL